jgi:hypothetical protein
MARTVRDQVPAALLVALLHGAVAFALLHVVIVENEPDRTNRESQETEISLSRETPPPPPKRRRRLPPAGGSAAPSLPYFNPYAYQSPPATADTTVGIATALSACDPARLDLASREVRTICDRIGLALKSDPGRFGVTADVADPVHWRRELARREAPFLAPCMSPDGFDVLYTLSCLYENVFIGYKPEHRRRYSE